MKKALLALAIIALATALTGCADIIKRADKVAHFADKYCELGRQPRLEIRIEKAANGIPVVYGCDEDEAERLRAEFITPYIGAERIGIVDFIENIGADREICRKTEGGQYCVKGFFRKEDPPTASPTTVPAKIEEE